MKREAKAASSWLDPDFEAKWPKAEERQGSGDTEHARVHNAPAREETAKKRRASARAIDKRNRLKESNLKPTNKLS